MNPKPWPPLAASTLIISVLAGLGVYMSTGDWSEAVLWVVVGIILYGRVKDDS